MCCSHKEPPTRGGKGSQGNICTPDPGQLENDWNCPNAGKCCDRSTLLDPNPGLKKQCAVCTVYNPCDDRCAARPDSIRNAQHTPMVLGVLLSLLCNGYIVYTYFFDETIRGATITKLLMCVSAVQIVFCVCLLLQELSFRVPNDPCTTHECPDVSTWYAWPTWGKVAKTFYTSSESQLPSQRTMGGLQVGQRGYAINWCQPMSFINQLTWTAVSVCHAYTRRCTTHS